ncbi:hypothetical protein NKR23_g6497 [Pleurostoma richardsiae]|uniref:Tetraspanin n=1 Tax=Pleurostoma richardsiae TaxID=41990 RepID=A0AA38RP38_9PEZI|nr:hypothetical protein NKR23_g6497 [Pleurostoma richardsiae]
MAGLMLIYIVIILALVAVAIYEHVDASSLSLPIPPTLTILTFILPLLAAANALFLPRLLSQSVSSSQWHLLHPAVLQTLQAILTTVLATLFLSSAVPSDTLNCGLTTTWQRLFSAHDASSIQRIQDAFDCCGLNSVRDRAWPWRAAGVVQCPERYGRSDACAVPWRSAMQRNAGVEFGVTIAVGLLQIISFFLARRFRPDRREGGWADLLNRPQVQNEWGDDN